MREALHSHSHFHGKDAGEIGISTAKMWEKRLPSWFVMEVPMKLRSNFTVTGFLPSDKVCGIAPFYSHANSHLALIRTPGTVQQHTLNHAKSSNSVIVPNQLSIVSLL